MIRVHSRFDSTPRRRAGTFVAIGDQNGTVTVSDTTRASSMSPRWTASAHENAVFDVAWTCDDAACSRRAPIPRRRCSTSRQRC